AKVLNLIEKALDEVALTVEREIALSLGLAVGFWGNDRRDFPLCKAVDQRIGIVSLVCDQGFRIGIFNQVLRANQIVGLPRREHQIGGGAPSGGESVGV